MINTKLSRPPSSRQAGSVDSRAMARKSRVLCIDDDPDISHAIEMALGNFHIELACKFSGQQGIWSCISDPPDLIVTDWMMPEGSGEELMMTLKRNRDTAGIPIVVLTCLRGERLRNRLFSQGVAGFIQKPISRAKFLSEIGRHIDLVPFDWASTDVG